LGFLRPEAVYVTYSVPHTSLAMAGITTQAILGNSEYHIKPVGNIYDDCR